MLRFPEFSRMLSHAMFVKELFTGKIENLHAHVNPISKV